MAKKVRAKITAGRPIIFDFNVDGEIIPYNTVCPNCGSENFVISLDKTRITCNNTDCLSRIFRRRPLKETESDLDGIKWIL